MDKLSHSKSLQWGGRQRGDGGVVSTMGDRAELEISISEEELKINDVIKQI